MPIQVIPTRFVKTYIPTPISLPDDEWQGQTIAALLAHLAIPTEITLSILVNGERQAPEYALRAGDVIKLIPLLTGG